MMFDEKSTDSFYFIGGIKAELLIEEYKVFQDFQDFNYFKDFKDFKYYEDFEYNNIIVNIEDYEDYD